MAGRCPEHLEAEFIADVLSGMKTKHLAKKYGRVRRTISEWKRRLREAGRLADGRQKGGDTLRFREVGGNYAEASSQGNRIQTLEQLLSAAHVDLDTWQVKDWGVKKWEVGAKIKLADIQYDQGKADGWIQHRGLGVKDLWSVWAKFIRREPVAIQPAIQPIDIGRTWHQPKAPEQIAGRALIAADAQFGFEWEPPQWRLNPFHDREALDLLLQIATDAQPDIIELLGDWQDLTIWTDRWARLPKFYGTTQPALLECAWWLGHLREACPNAVIRYHMGNHEQRMDTATATHLREACELKPADGIDLPPAMSIRNLLGLDSLGIKWVGGYPDDITWLGDAVRVQHGHIARKKPLSSVTELLKQGKAHQICGHIHRDEMVSESYKDDDGRMYQRTGYCPGALCRIDGTVPGSSIRHNWRQGIGVVDWSGRNVNITHIPINGGRAIWDSRVYEARDRRDNLRADLSKWNW